MNQRWARLSLFLLLALALVLLFCPIVALARAGGGGGYHSGGGGGGGGSGGGGGIELLFDLIILLFRYPKIGLPLLAVIALLIWWGGRQGASAYQSNVIRKGAVAMSGSDKAAAIARIRQHDSNFDEATFYERFKVAFDKIQTAWSTQLLTKVRPFISDGVYERFTLQIQEQMAEGYRDHMENVRIIDCGIVALSTSGLFDEMGIRVTASAVDWRESLAHPGKRISGSAGPETFTEIWTFLRRRGAVSNFSRAGLIEGNCPNCGAAIEMNQSANCTHCKAELRSGEYDWVLTEITQEVEWSVPQRDAIPGAAPLRQRDPGFDPASIEDRASVMFWRRATADRIGKIDPLRKIALPDFAADHAKRLRAPPGQPRNFVADCAVGSVQTLSLTGDTDWDRCAVEIRWSGKRFTADPAGHAKSTGQDVWSSEIFVLAKRASVPTDAGKNISSAHCPNCGAPESGGASNACEFCGTVLNDGSHGWVLERTLPRTDPQAQALLRGLSGMDQINGEPPPFIPTPDAMGLLTWLVKCATADGNVDVNERQMLQEVAEHRGIPMPQIDALIDAGLRGDLAVAEPSSVTEARSWVDAIAEEAWADGKLTAEESALLQQVAQRAGLSQADVDLALKRAKAKVFQRARAAIRNRNA